jgi:hypothetical protein
MMTYSCLEIQISTLENRAHNVIEALVQDTIPLIGKEQFLTALHKQTQTHNRKGQGDELLHTTHCSTHHTDQSYTHTMQIGKMPCAIMIRETNISYLDLTTAAKSSSTLRRVGPNGESTWPNDVAIGWPYFDCNYNSTKHVSIFV